MLSRSLFARNRKIGNAGAERLNSSRTNVPGQPRQPVRVQISDFGVKHDGNPQYRITVAVQIFLDIDTVDRRTAKSLSDNVRNGILKRLNHRTTSLNARYYHDPSRSAIGPRFGLVHDSPPSPNPATPVSLDGHRNLRYRLVMAETDTRNTRDGRAIVGELETLYAGLGRSASCRDPRVYRNRNPARPGTPQRWQLCLSRIHLTHRGSEARSASYRSFGRLTRPENTASA